MAGEEKPFQLKDRFGVLWVVQPKTVGTGGSLKVTGYNVALVGPEANYATNPGTSVVFTPDKAKIPAEINAYVDDYIASGGTPPKRAGDITVTAGRGGGMLLLLLLGIAWLADKKGRR